jgi:GNAT superfamily N-acetyltransferase
MAAYLEGRHHPQQALAPRTAFVALAGDDIVGYIAAHVTNRYGCGGEVQYLYVVPRYRRHGVARALLRFVARWFQAQSIARVCVNADVESAGAVAFYSAEGAAPLNKHWYLWEDFGIVLDQGSQ